MSIEREIMVSCDVTRLPPDVEAAMSPAEREAFQVHAKVLRRLAKSATHPDIKRYLRHLAMLGYFRLKLYSEDESPFQVYFQHTVVEAKNSCEIRLPRPEAVPENLPLVLKQLYQSFGGIREAYGGLRRPEEILQFSKIGYWLSRKNKLKPKQVFIFYEVGNGDSIGYDAAGSGVFYDHEEGILQPWSLEGFISTIFEDWVPTK